MNSPAARTIRILAEFIEPNVRFRKFRIHDTVVFFGSARVRSSAETRRDLEEAEEKKRKGLAGAEAAVESARVALDTARYYDDAVELSRLMTAWSKGLGKGRRRFIVCSGGGPGIMEAANRGAKLAKGISIGFNISLPREQEPNPYISPALNFEFHYFFIRKYWFAYLAKALVIFPGGYGTLDELAEMLTLVQTQKITKKVVIVIYGSEYWKRVLNFDEMVKWGMIGKEDLDLIRFCDTPKEAFDFLSRELIRLYGKWEVPNET